MPRIPRPSRRQKALIAVFVTAILAFPLGALAAHQFTDVPDSHPFHYDIDAVADANVTGGCGGGKYCPNSFVTRGQMAAFLNRLGALAADKTPVVNADKLDGLDSSAFVQPLFAVINADGTLARGSGVVDSSNLSDGNYEVIFNRNVAGCAFTATLGDGFLGTYDGEVSATNRLFNSSGVFVATNNSAGTETDIPFHLVVTCASTMVLGDVMETAPEANKQD